MLQQPNGVNPYNGHRRFSKQAAANFMAPTPNTKGEDMATSRARGG